MQDAEQDKFKKLEWMLDETVPLSDNEKDEYIPPYGNVTELNSCRLIMDSLGAETLKEIGENAIKLLDTSVAIYEANGDYAFGMFSSGWCRIMDFASRELCKTDDNQKALSCGKWLCHENCWNDSAKKAIETGMSTDIECVGGIHLYAEPIYAGKRVIGTINIGYGDPPKDPDRLKVLAEAFCVDPEKLKEIGESYKSRPEFIVDVTKQLLGAFAKLIGKIVGKAEAERKQKEAQERETHLKNVLKAILDVNQLIVKESDPHRLIQKVCENLTGSMVYFNAWIALLDKDSRCVTQTGAAVSDGNFASVRNNLNRGVFPACMQRALETSELVVIKDLAAECHDCPLASRYAGHAALVHRLEHEGTIFGILSVSTPAQFAHDTEEQDLFLEVSNDLAFALSKIETDKELQLKNQIIRTIPHPMAIVSSDYRYLVVNEAYCKVYGTAPENITGRPVADFISPEVFEQEIRPHLDRCLTGETVRYEIQMDFPGTGPCWMRMEYTPYRDEDNRIVGVVSHGMDITERKRAEEQRESLARKYASVLNSTSDAVVAGELDGRITVFNPGAEKLFGCTADEALGTPIRRFCPEDRLAEQAEMMRRVRDEGTVADYETERLTADGQRIPVEISLGLNTDDQGRPLEINAIVRNITKRKQAEEALRESLQRLEFALQGGNLGMWDWNPQDGAVVYSDLWAQMLEYRPDEVEPTVDFFKQHVHPEDLSAVLDRLTGHVEGPLPVYESEYRIRTKSGRWLWVLDRGRIVERDKDGSPVRVTGLIADITERKEAEEALRVSEEKHRRLFETMAQGVIYQAADGAIISANPAAERILGLSFEQMQGKTSMDPRWKMILEDGTTVPGTEHPAMIALRTGETVGPVIRGVFHPDKNAYAWLSITAIPLYQPDENIPVQTYATFEDITERKQAIEALMEREAFIKTTLDNLPVGVSVNSVDPKVHFTYMNDNFVKFYRTTREALAEPNDFWEVVYPDATFREELKKRVLEDCAGNDPERMHWKDVPVPRPGKKPFYITAKNIPLPESNLMVSTVWDVTDRKQAEETLREQLDFSESLIETAQAIILVLDPQGRIVRFNPYMEELVGYDLDEVKGKDWFESFIKPENGNTVRSVFQKATDDIQTRGNVNPIIAKDGRTILVEWYDKTLKDKDGLTMGILAIGYDITERKRADELIRESAERAKMQRNLIAQLTFEDSIVNTSIDDALKTVTRKLAATLQVDRVGVWLLSEDETKLQRLALYDAGTGLHSQIDDLNAVDIPSYFGALRKDSQVDAGDAQNDPRTKELTDNYLIPLQISALLDSAIQQDGRLIGILSAEHRGPVREWHADEKSFLSAITNLVAQLFANAERKQAEEAVRLNEEKLKSLFRVAPTGIGVVINRTFTEVNPKVCEMSGYRPEELLGKSASILYPTQEEHEFVGKEKYRQIAKHGTGAVETRWQRKDGKIIDVLLSSTPVDSEDLSKGATFTALDITEIKCFREELKRLNAELELKVEQRTSQLEASNKDLEAFSYSVSHDLRAPLRHISGYVDLLNNRFREDLPEKAAHYLNEVKDSAQQMGILIDDLLQFSRTGRQDLRRENMDMNAAVQETLEKLKVDTKDRNITWTIAELPRVFGDYTLLKQVWMNMLDNAVKYTQTKDDAEIEVGFTREADQWEFFVRDNGAGFDMQYVHKLFGVFQRLHSPAQFEGTGIGLANVQRIIHRHGGRVRAEGQQEKGATFYFTIPKNIFDEGGRS